jgi:hypothetical protein
MLNKLCMPALIYLIYIVVHITIDVYYGLYNMAFVKIWIGIIVTLLLNIMCENNMSFFAWLIISIPFILMTVIAIFVLYSLGLDPATGKVKTETKTTESTQTNTTENTETTSVNPIYITNEDVPLYPTSTTPVEITLYSTTPPAISSTIPAEFTVYSPSSTSYTTSTTSTTPAPSTSGNNAYDDIPPPSIYANPIAVNYHGVLADSVRSVQSNFN